jgi:hypothetical protein
MVLGRVTAPICVGGLLRRGCGSDRQRPWSPISGACLVRGEGRQPRTSAAENGSNRIALRCPPWSAINVLSSSDDRY